MNLLGRCCGVTTGGTLREKEEEEEEAEAEEEEEEPGESPAAKLKSSSSLPFSGASLSGVADDDDEAAAGACLSSALSVTDSKRGLESNSRSTAAFSSKRDRDSILADCCSHAVIFMLCLKFKEDFILTPV